MVITFTPVRHYHCAVLLQPLLHLKEIISSCFEAKSETQLSGYVLLLVKQEAGVCLKLLFQTTRRQCE